MHSALNKLSSSFESDYRSVYLCVCVCVCVCVIETQSINVCPSLPKSFPSQRRKASCLQSYHLGSPLKCRFQVICQVSERKVIRGKARSFSPGLHTAGKIWKKAGFGGGGLKEWAKGNRKKGGKGKEPPAERSEVSADSRKGDMGGQEHCPKRISANFLWAQKVRHCLSKKIYVKTRITFHNF